ncbi:MAG TPA: ComEC/Rec2 family competence protein, partial [Pyrinomonadaceae bacterium]
MERAPHQPLFTQAPLAQLAAAFSTGLLSADHIHVPVFVLVSCGILFSLLTLIAVVKHRIVLGGAWLLVAMFFAGAIVENNDGLPPSNPLKDLLQERLSSPGDPIQLTGVIDGAVDFAFDRVYFTLKVDEFHYQGVVGKGDASVALTALVPKDGALKAYDSLALRHGARLNVTASLRRADNFRNPGVPLLSEYLDRKGYDATAFVKGPSMIQRHDDAQVFRPLVWLYEWRQQIQKEIDRRFSPLTAGVLDAALLGNRYNLSPVAAERFRTGGTFHVLVISGLHISFIGCLVLALAKKLTTRRSLQFILSTLVLWSYTLGVGAESSVVRAALMFTTVALGPVIFRRATSLNALGGTAIVLLVWQPRNLFDPSFQLTFLSVLAIVVVAWPALTKFAAVGSWRPSRNTPYPPALSQIWLATSETLFWSERQWRRELDQAVHNCRLFKTPLASRFERYHLQPVARYAFGAMTVSLSVQLVLLPLLVVYFHRVSLASLVLNITVGLVMTGLAFTSLVALIVGQLSMPSAAPLIRLAETLNWLMIHSVDPFARLGIASIRLPNYSGPAAIVYWLYYVPLIVMAVLLFRWDALSRPGNRSHAKQTFRVALFAQVVLIGIVIFHPFSAGRPNGNLHIDFLDVGQGDSALVTMPDGSTLLVDGGGRPMFSTGSDEVKTTTEAQFGRDARSIGEAVVSEYLWWRGLDSIDYVLATHADADHIDGLNDILRNFHVRAALVGRAPIADREFQTFAGTIDAEDVPLQLIGKSDFLHFGSVSAEVLWPSANNDPQAPSRNNDSVVLLLMFGRRSLLLTGDIEKGAEAALLRGGECLDVDVVKVPHHGSKTSSTVAFVAITHPSIAIISVGQTSIFGHPNREVV